MRSWDLFGREIDGRWLTIGPEFYVKLHGCASPIPVVVSEASDGEYRGWLAVDETVPHMILHEKIFEIQFPYGSAAEERAGRGRVVSLSVTRSE